MRDIKFRAWNKEEKIMVYNNEDNSSDYWDGAIGSDVEMVNSILKYDEKYSSKSNYIWMQYTGLKDKNNKEIYEGDILKWTHPFFKENKLEYKILVVKDISEGLMIKPDCRNGWIEVIGNIYENPELIENKIAA